MRLPTDDELLAYACEWLSEHIGCPNEVDFLMCLRKCIGGDITGAQCWRKLLTEQWQIDTEASGWVATGPKTAIQEARQ